MKGLLLKDFYTIKSSIISLLITFMVIGFGISFFVGLAFVREIVRVHDGSICIKSGKTGGTIFEVTFAQHSM